MALTNLNALGSAIRTKVGEAEKKTLPQLKSIVDNQLVYPQGEYTATTNGIYDVKSYASVNVATDERTEEDEKNAEIVRQWTNVFSTFTGNFAIGASTLPIGNYVGELPLLDARNSTGFSSAFSYAKATEISINVGDKATNFSQMFNTCSNLKTVHLIGNTENSTTFLSMFSSCGMLEEVDGEINFTRATSVTTMFLGCSRLKEVHFTANTLSVGIFNLNASEVLSRASVLSAINSLVKGAGKEIRFSGTVKGYMTNNWKCKLNAATGLYEDSTDSDAISYSQAITSTDEKGWTLA